MAANRVTTADIDGTITVVDSKCTYESAAYSQQSDKDFNVLSESTWSPLGVHLEDTRSATPLLKASGSKPKP